MPVIYDGIEYSYDEASIRVAEGVYTEDIDLYKDITIELGWDSEFKSMSDGDPVILMDP